jgi:hypothetical protein
MNDDSDALEDFVDRPLEPNPKRQRIILKTSLSWSTFFESHEYSAAVSVNGSSTAHKTVLTLHGIFVPEIYCDESDRFEGETESEGEEGGSSATTFEEHGRSQSEFGEWINAVRKWIDLRGKPKGMLQFPLNVGSDPPLTVKADGRMPSILIARDDPPLGMDYYPVKYVHSTSYDSGSSHQVCLESQNKTRDGGLVDFNFGASKFTATVEIDDRDGIVWTLRDGEARRFTVDGRSVNVNANAAFTVSAYFDDEIRNRFEDNVARRVLSTVYESLKRRHSPLHEDVSNWPSATSDIDQWSPNPSSRSVPESATSDDVVVRVYFENMVGMRTFETFAEGSSGNRVEFEPEPTDDEQDDEQDDEYVIPERRRVLPMLSNVVIHTLGSNQPDDVFGDSASRLELSRSAPSVAISTEKPSLFKSQDFTWVGAPPIGGD